METESLVSKEGRRLEILARMKTLEAIDPMDPDANDKLAEYKKLEAELAATDPVRTDDPLTFGSQNKTPNIDNRAAIEQLTSDSEK